ncbi:hypothetical protein ACE3MZ_16940 [Paenibacillus sp. WLX1005]|uniref:hypothetical protein n=1 Tax=Paenibacillus sp. WLX1005 TaxID=3243766 RepID=UPI003983E356
MLVKEKSEDRYNIIKYTYMRFFKYHMLIMLIPSLLTVAIFFNTINSIILDFFTIYRFLFFDREDQSFTFSAIVFFLKKAVKLVLIVTIIQAIFAIFKSGLYFLPALAVKNKLRFIHILHIGAKSWLLVVLVTLASQLIFGAFHTLLAIIPIVNVSLIILIPFELALTNIFLDYWLSANCLQKKWILSSPAYYFKSSFIKQPQYWGWVVLLGFSYILAIGSLVRPLIQMKVAQNLNDSMEVL